MFLCVDVCLNRKTYGVCTCKSVVSLHVHYHLFMNFDFFRQVRIRESTHNCAASQLVSQPSCMMGSYCALSSINRHKIYENLFENNTIHFDDCCCCSIVCFHHKLNISRIVLFHSYLIDSHSKSNQTYHSFLGSFIDMPYYYHTTAKP